MSDRLNQFFNAIADAGREIIHHGKRKYKTPGEHIAVLCKELLATEGEASGTAIARDILTIYKDMEEDDRLGFFQMLESEFGVDKEKIAEHADVYLKERDLPSLMSLTSSVEAPRQLLIRLINMAPNGTETIVAMRADLLKLLPHHPELRLVEMDFKHLLLSWFNRGFLYLQEINWHTPADVLEKIMDYESVHEMEGWHDLRRRLTNDRRCFAFFHPALRDDPLIFVEVALTQGMADAIQPLLNDDSAKIPANLADTAVFYSINNCQTGLRGISFGNFLIKQVVFELLRDLPNIKTFTTLSPIPGYRAWLEKMLGTDSELVSPDDREVLKVLHASDWHHSDEVHEKMKATIMRLCAHYLLEEKRNNEPLDPVARFHLRNGARVERINWLADTSERGIANSAQWPY